MSDSITTTGDGAASAPAASGAPAPATSTGPARFQHTSTLPFGSLKKSAMRLLMGNGVLMGCRFAVAVLLAKMAGVEILGQYTLANALVSPVILFFTFNMRAAMVADANNETTFGNWFMTRNLGLLAALLAILGICAWEQTEQMSWAYLAIILFVGLGKIFNQASELCTAMYLKRERHNHAAWSGAWTGIALLAPFCVVLPICALIAGSTNLPHDLAAAGSAWALIIGAAAALLVYLWYDRPKVIGAPDCDPTWSPAEVKRVLIQVFPLGLVMLVINLCDSLPRIIMKYRTGDTEALGYIGALTTLALGANLFLIQIGIASANRLAQYYNRDFRQFLRLTGKLVALALAIGAALMVGTLVLGKWMLAVFFKPEYSNYYPEFLIVIGSQCLALVASIFGITTTQMRLYWLQVTVHIIVLAVTVITAWILITPDHPVAGGAWTFFIRTAAQVLLYAGCMAWGIRRGFQAQSVLAPRGDAAATDAAQVSAE